MKKIIFILSSVFLTAAAFGQTKPQQTVTIKTPTVQCDMCKEAIETYLKRIDGVLFVNVKVKQKQTVVNYLTDRTNMEMIKASLPMPAMMPMKLQPILNLTKAFPGAAKSPKTGEGSPNNS